MKKDFLRALLLAAAAALLAPLSSAAAQDIQLASHAEMNDVYARLADLETRLAAVNSGVGCADGCGDDAACCDDGCKAGFVGGVEVLWLKAFQSDGNFGDFNYRDGYRLWVGYQRADGLGVRARFFDYFQTAGNGDNIDVETYDLEVFDTIDLGCYWTLVAGAGLRYFEYESNASDNGDLFRGIGPVATAELYRAINDDWQLYGIGRYSILADGTTNLAGGQEDITLSTLELQIGLQYDRVLQSGALGFARIGWEAQQFDDASDSEESVTLMGGVLSIGVMR
jgi:hypothetical protein